VREIILLSLALWIVTHTIAIEIPLTADAPKPLSCQLCLSGWVSLVTGVKVLTWDLGLWAFIAALATWALSVLIEAVYNRLQLIIL
jgi:hypothetical protein